MAYQPIENYGIIGNMRTAALVGMNGSLDWLCFPYFDSPSVFGAILDDKKGGRFQIAPAEPSLKVRQFYWPDTNVLVTRFTSPQGVAELQDFMPVGEIPDTAQRDQIVRRLRVSRGELKFKIECSPYFDYGRVLPETQITEHGVIFSTPSACSPRLTLGLSTNVRLERAERGVTSLFSLSEGQSAVFVLHPVKPGGCSRWLAEEETETLFRNTVAFWRRWLSQCTYEGRWKHLVFRSALALKLLTFEPTGAIVAAPTCSLPESIGGDRNWDYRYCWIRDSAFTIYGLLRLGLTSEATAYMSWMDARCREAESTGVPLQIVYGLDGRKELPEETLDHWEGYRGSRPVRIGNAAHSQLQLDIYGELMDSVYLINKYARPLSYESWTDLRWIINWLCENWRQPDEGIWEVRSGKRDFVYSKLMCWVALDRALRLADKRSFPANRGRWLQVRDEIYEEVMARGWSSKRKAFVQYYGSDTLDASSLIMPLVFFMSPTDPKILSTVSAISQPLRAGGLLSDGLVYRYNSAESGDGLTSQEGTFNMCSFWLVEALTRAGQTDPALMEEARLLFERMQGYANHLGLYGEEISPCGEALGNFPQAFTHVAFISAAFNLDRRLRNR